MEWFLSLCPAMQGLFATLFTYLVTAAGACLVFFFKDVKKAPLDLMMGFAAGVMIAASFWSLLSPAIDLAARLGHNTWLTAAAGFCSGGLFIIISDLLLSKVSENEYKVKKYKQPLTLVGAMTLHNIPEGLAIGVAFGSAAMGIEGASVLSAMLLAFGIGVQNFPEGLCSAVPMRKAGASRMKSFLIGQSSGLVEPVSGVIGAIAAMSVRAILPLALTFSAGAMIAVVCSELIPESFADNKALASVGVLAGFSVMMILDVALG